MIGYNYYSEFIGYLKEWEKSVEQRNGFNAAQKKMMILSNETTEGLKIAGIHRVTNFERCYNNYYTCSEIFCGNDQIFISSTWSKIFTF